jgi:hypothetical protein
MTWPLVIELLDVTRREGIRRNQLKRSWVILDSCTKKRGKETN